MEFAGYAFLSLPCCRNLMARLCAYGTLHLLCSALPPAAGRLHGICQAASTLQTLLGRGHCPSGALLRAGLSAGLAGNQTTPALGVVITGWPCGPEQWPDRRWLRDVLPELYSMHAVLACGACTALPQRLRAVLACGACTALPQCLRAVLACNACTALPQCLRAVLALLHHTASRKACV